MWAVGEIAVFVKTHLDRPNGEDGEKVSVMRAAEYLESLHGHQFRQFHERLWKYINTYRPELRGFLFKVDRLIEDQILKEQVEHDWNEIVSALEKKERLN